MESEYPQEVLMEEIERYGTLLHAEILLLYTDGTVFLSRNQQRIGKKLFSAPIEQCVGRIIQGEEYWSEGFSHYYYSLPIVLQGITAFYLVIDGFDTARLPENCSLTAAGFTGLMEQIGRTNSSLLTVEDSDMQEVLIKGVLGSTLKGAALQSLAENLDLDCSMLRAVICIELVFARTSYFTQSCELLYDQVGDRLRTTILQFVRSHYMLTHQDISANYEDNRLIIVKSFIRTDKITKAYRVLERFCEQLRSDLYQFGLMEMRMAHGNLVDSISKLPESYHQANEFLRLGVKRHPDCDYYNSSVLLFDLLCTDLHPQISAKLIQPVLDALQDEGETGMDLLHCTEVIVDCGMSYAEAAKKLMLHRNTVHMRVERFCSLTGLDPLHNFHDAVIVKFAAMTARYRLSGLGERA